MKRTKKLLTGFIICMALAGGISISQRVQAAEDDFIIEDWVLSQDSVSDSEIQNEVTDIENEALIEDEILSQNDINDFVIPDRATSDDDFNISENYVGELVLWDYKGSGGNVVIPDGVKRISLNAFQNCTSLTSVTIPNSVVHIDLYTFSECTNLQEINVDERNPSYSSTDGILYNKDKTVLFMCPKGKINVSTIPKSVTSIVIGAFGKCTKLTNIEIPNSITKIDDGTFDECINLINITIPNSVTSIGWNAFHNCSSLTNVTIPNSVKEIKDSVFNGCTSLREINVDMGNPSYSSEDGVLYNKDKTILVAYPKGKYGDFIIPNSVTKIGFDAFSDCTSLTNITIPNSVTDIEYRAFRNCTNLMDVVISNSAVRISWGVFVNTPWLENKKKENPDQPLIINNILFGGQIENGTFMIPNGVTSICAEAFSDCDWTEREKVTAITIPSSVVSIGDNVFCGCENLQELTILNPKTRLGYYRGSPILDYGDGPTDFKNPVITIRGYANSAAQELANNMNSKPYYQGKTTFKFVALDGTGGNTPRPSVTPKPTKPKTPNKGTVLKSKSTTYTVTKKGSEVAFTKISSAAASVSIPATVKIGGINYKVTSISPNAFKGNKKLSKVNIGANITSIGKNAFNGCKNLKSIIIKTTKLKNAGQNAFKGIKSTALIKVPSKRLKAYKKLLKGKGQGKKVRITK